jgi:hypothetical protein
VPSFFFFCPQGALLLLFRGELVDRSLYWGLTHGFSPDTHVQEGCVPHVLSITKFYCLGFGFGESGECQI